MVAGPLTSTPFVSGLLLDRAFGKGLRLQAVVRDRFAAFDRHAECALRDARFGTDHGGQLVLQGRGDRRVDQLMLDLGAGLRRLARLVEP